MSARPPAAASSGPAAGGDVVPLSARVLTLSLVRIAVVVALIAVGLEDGYVAGPADVLVPLGYAAAAALLGAGVLLIPHRPAAIGALGVVLCLDGIALQVVQYHLGPTPAVQLSIGIFLVTVCLLSSFRTGIKLVIWQSLLIGIEQQGVRGGLFAPRPDSASRDAIPELIMLWVLVLVVCAGASVSERELRRRRHDAEQLQSFAAALHEGDEPALVLRRTFGFVVDDLNAGRAMLCTRRAGQLSVLIYHGLEPDRVAATGDSLLLERSSRPGEPALLLDLDPQFDPWLYGLLPGAHRLMVLPLGADADGSPLWIVFEHRRSGVRVERRVLSTLGQLTATAALALSRAVLFQQMQDHATTDALTRLANRRTFDARLAQSVAGLPAVPFAVILVDVDRFKAVNDTHGHQVGDQVLQAVAAALRAGAPAGATVARYGGEEFVVLLPGAGAAAALAVGEHLRLAVAAAAGPVRVTASFGIALGTPGCDPETLLPTADQALYRVKESGRNGVQLGTSRAEVS